MSSSTAIAWPSPVRFALALGLGLALSLAAAWAWGAALVEMLLPVVRIGLGWIDDRFGVRTLTVAHNWQDTVIDLQLGFSRPFVLGGRVVEPGPGGLLSVATPVGNLLQPLAIAPAIALALPGQPLQRFGGVVAAALFALGFLIVDLPVSLHAIAWDLITYSLGVDDFSPVLAWNQFMQSGGRLGVAAVFGVAGWRLARRMSLSAQKRGGGS